MPGWGRRAAQDTVAETGVDMTRFRTGGHLSSWAGKTPLDNHITHPGEEDPLSPDTGKGRRRTDGQDVSLISLSETTRSSKRTSPLPAPVARPMYHAVAGPLLKGVILMTRRFPPGASRDLGAGTCAGGACMTVLSTRPRWGVDSAGSNTSVHLLGGLFIAVDGERLDVPEGGKRLLAFLALADSVVDRQWAAESLWPDVSGDRAAGNLRSALWRLRSAGIGVVDSVRRTLSLTPTAVVDVDLLSQWAVQVIDESVPTERLSYVVWRGDTLDLLPGWYDDWVIFERERLRQRLLHALEVLSLRLVRQGRFGEAVEAALLAVQAEPLRESAQRALLTAHLAEGNLVEARRAYAWYGDLLARELDVRPGAELTRLIAGYPDRSAAGETL
jgi:DNA-binding SARP family transcriptional activator